MGRKVHSMKLKCTHAVPSTNLQNLPQICSPPPAHLGGTAAHANFFIRHDFKKTVKLGATTNFQRSRAQRAFFFTAKFDPPPVKHYGKGPVRAKLPLCEPARYYYRAPSYRQLLAYPFAAVNSCGELDQLREVVFLL